MNASINNVYKDSNKKHSVIKSLWFSFFIGIFLIFTLFISGIWKLAVPQFFEIISSPKIQSLLQHPSPTQDTSLPVNTVSMHVSLYVHKQQYYIGDRVEYILRNNSNSKVIRVHSSIFERFDPSSNSWISIRTITCPCNALCKIASFYILKPQEFMHHQWEQKEEWCEDQTNREVHSISQQVPTGTYRITAEVSTNPSETDKARIYSENFPIISNVN